MQGYHIYIKVAVYIVLVLLAENDLWNNSFWRLDASIKYRFTKLISVYFNLANINNQPDRRFFGTENYTTSRYYYGTTGNLGVECNL